MKIYNKLIRIRYNNRIFDVFDSENHKKFFLEVREIEDKEKYFYLNIKEYLYLNRIFNIEGKDVLDAKKKFTMLEKISTTSVIICGLAVGGLYLNTTLCKENPYRNISNVDYLEVSTLENLSEYISEDVSFDQLRETLSKNDNLNDYYKKIINEFIDCLEDRLSLIDLRFFNEQLKDLVIEEIPRKDWKDSSSGGKYIKDINTIQVPEGNQFDKFVLYHELIHVLRGGYIEIDEFKINCDFRNSNYGRAFNEAFTELIAHYLLFEDHENYFDYDKHDYAHYSEYTSTLYHLLKIIGDDYSLYDYFNNDVLKFEKVLSKFKLEEIITLYDVDIVSLYNPEIINESRAEIIELEKKILLYRIEQIEESNSIKRIYDIASSIKGLDAKDVIEADSKRRKENSKWLYSFSDCSEETEINGEMYYNPRIRLYYNDELIYSFNVLDETNNFDKFFNDKINIAIVLENGELNLKIVEKNKDSYVDVINRHEVKVLDVEPFSINYLLFDIDINLNNFLNSDIFYDNCELYKKYLDNLEELRRYKAEGASDSKIYKAAGYLFKENPYVFANLVLDDVIDDANSWEYRFKNIDNDVTKSTNPIVRIYKKNDIVYEGNMFQGMQIEMPRVNNIYLLVINEDGKDTIKFARLSNEKFIEFDTNSEFDINECIHFIGLSSILGEWRYDVEINLDEFMNSDSCLEMFEMTNRIVETIRK